MATVCDYCGHRDNEVKSSGGIEPLGTKIELKLLNSEDMARDVLKVSPLGVYFVFFSASKSPHLCGNFHNTSIHFTPKGVWNTGLPLFRGFAEIPRIKKKNKAISMMRGK